METNGTIVHIPVVLMPAIWTVLALSVNEFDNWLGATIYQIPGREDKPLINSLNIFFQIDPVLLTLGIAGIISVLPYTM